MTDSFKPTNAQEYSELINLFKDRHQSDDPEKPSMFDFTVTQVTQPHANATRVFGKLSADGKAISMEDWIRPNVAFRSNLPVQPEELAGIDEAKTASRAYTVSTFDIESQTISFDVVSHEGNSPAMIWLQQVQVGDTITLNAPNSYALPDVGSKRLMICDSTAVPAARNIISMVELPGDTTLVVQGHADEYDDLVKHAPDGVTVVRTEKSLEEAFIEQDLDDLDYVWACGEGARMRAIRKYCRDELGLKRDQTHILAYWQDGQSYTVRDLINLRIARDTFAAGGTMEDLQKRFEKEDG